MYGVSIQEPAGIQIEKDGNGGRAGGGADEKGEGSRWPKLGSFLKSGVRDPIQGSLCKILVGFGRAPSPPATSPGSVAIPPARASVESTRTRLPLPRARLRLRSQTMQRRHIEMVRRA
ncbi:hypothetical protein SEVIR_9G140933v4 [Setaria viridis]